MEVLVSVTDRYSGRAEGLFLWIEQQPVDVKAVIAKHYGGQNWRSLHRYYWKAKSYQAAVLPFIPYQRIFRVTSSFICVLLLINKEFIHMQVHPNGQR